MARINAGFLVFISVFLVLVQCKLSPQERLKAEKDCVDEVKIDYNIILEVKHTLKVSDDVKYKHFLNCYYRKQGFLTEHGELKFRELRGVLTENGYTDAQAEAVLRPCEDLKPEYISDLPVEVLKCLLANLLAAENDL